VFGIGLWIAATFAVAEPMDGDAGLYRIGSINYASAYEIIPGLANLHDRFGFNSSLWPFAAFTGNGIWAGQGWRIVTGIFVAALVFEIAFRVLTMRPLGRLPGDWFAIIAGAFLGAIVLTDSGRWIPSPAQDVAAYVFAAISTAYLVDDLYQGKARTMWCAGVALVTASVAASLRPLGWVFFAATLLVIVLVNFPHASQLTTFLRSIWTQLAAPIVFALLLAGVMLARDAILSGWLFFPLTWFPLPVSWAASDPTVVNAWITSWGRSPGDPYTQVMADWSWFFPWLERFNSTREVYLLKMMAIGLVIPLLWSSGRNSWAAKWKIMIWATAPSLIAFAVWFLSAPDIRFGWSATLGIVAIPLSLLFASGAYPEVKLRVLGAALLVAMILVNIPNGRLSPRGREAEIVPSSIGPFSLSLSLSPPNVPRISRGTLMDGTVTTHPVDNGECWTVFPLCVLKGTGNNVRKLGSSIQEGFAHSQIDRESR
jgi:hypothetical protein